jgi:hypothetical protein
MPEWIMALSAVANVFLVVVLVYVTRSYADAAHEQADASVRMAEEMRTSREDGSRPVLDIRQIEQDEFGVGDEAMAQAMAQLTHNDHVWCTLRNIGRGPALNIQAHLSRMRPPRWEMLGMLAVDEEAPREPFATLPQTVTKADTTFIEVWYEDVYGRKFSSRRLAIFGDGNPRLGPLETREEHSDDS